MTRFAAACALLVLLAGGLPARAAGSGMVVGSGRSGTVGPAWATTGRAPSDGSAAARSTRPPRGYSPPITPLAVVRGFESPPTPYGPGHRGVDLAAASGAAVAAAANGRVSFAGQVAGRGVVVIVHPGGVRTEYEPVTPTVRAGAAVARGQPIGHVHGSHGSCPANRCLHWGASREHVYFDPLTLLSPLGPVRLLPWAAQARG